LYWESEVTLSSAASKERRDGESRVRSNSKQRGWSEEVNCCCCYKGSVINRERKRVNIIEKQNNMKEPTQTDL
jgi:hypothetical protein